MHLSHLLMLFHSTQSDMGSFERDYAMLCLCKYRNSWSNQSHTSDWVLPGGEWFLDK